MGPEFLSPEQLLHKTVQDFFDTHLYKGFDAPFQLDRLEEDENVARIRPESNAFVTILKGNWEECISEFDDEWRKGLFQTGQQFEMELRLPYWYYEK